MSRFVWTSTARRSASSAARTTSAGAPASACAARASTASASSAKASVVRSATWQRAWGNSASTGSSAAGTPPERWYRPRSRSDTVRRAPKVRAPSRTSARRARSAADSGRGSRNESGTGAARGPGSWATRASTRSTSGPGTNGDRSAPSFASNARTTSTEATSDADIARRSSRARSPSRSRVHRAGRRWRPHCWRSTRTQVSASRRRPSSGAVTSASTSDCRASSSPDNAPSRSGSCSSGTTGQGAGSGGGHAGTGPPGVGAAATRSGAGRPVGPDSGISPAARRPACRTDGPMT
jgi:hypothetical protein